MSTTVTLAVLEGLQAEKKFVFNRPWVCAVGRFSDCELRIPSDLYHMNVSRHHCVLTIDPPEITVRDCGSRNGTFVNGIKIGQRSHTQDAGELSPLAMPEYRLYDGDRLQVGDTVFQVQIAGPAVCSSCGGDIPEERKDQARVGRGEYLCAWCQTQRVAPASEDLANSNYH